MSTTTPTVAGVIASYTTLAQNLDAYRVCETLLNQAKLDSREVLTHHSDSSLCAHTFELFARDDVDKVHSLGRLAKLHSGGMGRGGYLQHRHVFYSRRTSVLSATLRDWR